LTKLQPQYNTLLFLAHPVYTLLTAGPGTVTHKPISYDKTASVRELNLLYLSGARGRY